MASRTLFFVPAYNQVRELPTVLDEIRTAALEEVDFLLVNNGSQDGSEDLIRDSGHPFLDIPKNRGIGYSYILALEWAIDHEYSYFGAMAANAKMLPSEIPRLLKPLRENRADYVTGSRFMEGGASPNLPFFRRATIPLVNVIAWLTTGQRLTDATNGFRAFRLSIMDQALFDWRAEWLWTYDFEYYLYANVLRAPHLRTLEVPTTMRYPKTGAYSKIRPGRDWWRMIRPWFLAHRSPGFAVPSPEHP